MTAGHIGNRHPRPCGFGQNGELLIHRTSSAPLNRRIHFHSIGTAGHSRMTRRTPRDYPAVQPRNICNPGSSRAGVQVELRSAVRLQALSRAVVTAIRSVLLAL